MTTHNTSGFVPLDLRVLVMPDPVEDKIGSIYVPDSAKEKAEYATIKATLIAVGENAWEEAAARSACFTRPAPGDRVVIAKYGGILLDGEDGRKYRIMNDTDVIAKIGE